MIIYRLDLTTPPPMRSCPAGAQCIILASFGDVLRNFALLTKNWGFLAAIKTAAKVFSGRRIPYFSVMDGRIVQSGWANIGFCRYYPVEPNAVVLGTLFTEPEYRRRGLSTSAKSQMMAFLYSKGYRRLYADTSEANIPAQRTSEKLGFQRISAAAEAALSA
jgi:GNAT superfamily N-acetyltransferase